MQHDDLIERLREADAYETPTYAEVAMVEAAAALQSQAAEIARLREALEKIAAECWVTAGTDAQMYSRWRKLAVERVDIARAALSGDER